MQSSLSDRYHLADQGFSQQALQELAEQRMRAAAVAHVISAQTCRKSSTCEEIFQQLVDNKFRFRDFLLANTHQLPGSGKVLQTDMRERRILQGDLPSLEAVSQDVTAWLQAHSLDPAHLIAAYSQLSQQLQQTVEVNQSKTLSKRIDAAAHAAAAGRLINSNSAVRRHIAELESQLCSNKPQRVLQAVHITLRGILRKGFRVQWALQPDRTADQMQHISVLQILPSAPATTEGAAAPPDTLSNSLHVSTQLACDLPAEDMLVLAQPISPDLVLLVITQPHSSLSAAHVTAPHSDWRSQDQGHLKASWTWSQAFESADFDARTRCLALVCRSEACVRVCSMDAGFTDMQTDVTVALPWLPSIRAVRLLPGRQVNIATSALLQQALASPEIESASVIHEDPISNTPASCRNSCGPGFLLMPSSMARLHASQLSIVHSAMCPSGL